MLTEAQPWNHARGHATLLSHLGACCRNCAHSSVSHPPRGTTREPSGEFASIARRCGAPLAGRERNTTRPRGLQSALGAEAGRCSTSRSSRACISTWRRHRPRRGALASRFTKRAGDRRRPGLPNAAGSTTTATVLAPLRCVCSRTARADFARQSIRSGVLKPAAAVVRRAGAAVRSDERVLVRRDADC